jgi:hypothetical protein
VIHDKRLQLQIVSGVVVVAKVITVSHKEFLLTGIFTLSGRLSPHASTKKPKPP